MAQFDPVRILSVLNDHGVRHVLIGGFAAAILGSPSVTQDLDICYDREPENLARLAEALQELNARLRGVDKEVPFQLDSRTLAAGDHFTFATDAGDFDCLGTPAGTQGYKDLALMALQVDLEGFSVSVAPLDDLIRMKKAAGRPKDRIAIEILGALKEETPNKNDKG